MLSNVSESNNPKAFKMFKNVESAKILTKERAKNPITNKGIHVYHFGAFVFTSLVLSDSGCVLSLKYKYETKGIITMIKIFLVNLVTVATSTTLLISNI